MIARFGAASASAAGGGVAHAPAPQADPELAKAKRKLADWETCPSRKTSAGQAKIKEYTAQVSAITARDEKAQQAAANSPITPGEVTASSALHSAGAAMDPSGAAPGGTRAAVGALGAYVDVYA